MAKKNWWIKAMAGALVIATAGMVIESGAQAQNGWNAASQEEPAAKKTPTPPPLQIPGSWDGTIEDSKEGSGTINLSFLEKSTKTKGTLSGTWTISYPDTAPSGAINDVGTITGSVVGTTVAVTLIPRSGDALGACRVIFNAVDATTEVLSGSYHYGSCGGGNSGTISLEPGPPPTTVFINVSDDYFYPPKVTINAGQTVEWTNNGFEDHTVTSNSGGRKCNPVSSEVFGSLYLDTGDTFEHTFNDAGTFGYYCVVHGCLMHGTITVK